MELKERVLTFIGHKGITNRAFEEKCGLGNGFVSKIGYTIRQDKLDLISNSFPDLNMNWLQHGIGNMINDASTANNNKIPFYEASTVGGRDIEVSIDAVSSPTSYIDTGDWFRNATAAMRHTGHSMVQYPKGCILALKEVKDWDLIIPGRDYVIETDEYRVTKQVQLIKEGYITAYSTNEDTYKDGRLIHPPFDIPISKIRHILLVLGYVVTENGNAIIHSNKI